MAAASPSPETPDLKKAEIETSQIMKLNDDCLACIFERLQDLHTEMAVSRVCRRFQSICLTQWRYSHSYNCLDLDEWREILPNSEDLIYFLQLMRPYIKELFVNSCLRTLLKDLSDMKIYVLPMVTCFYYEPEDVDCYPSDKSLLRMAQMLPNLRRLRLTTPIQGRYLSNFRQLQELHLYDDQHKDYELQQKYLDDLCNQLVDLRVLDIRMYDSISKLRLDNCVQCLKNLTTLKLNLATLKSVLYEVLELPSLRQLVVLLDTEWPNQPQVSVDNYDENDCLAYEFYEIMERKAKNIIGFAVDGYYMPLEPGWNAKLPIWTHKKLQRLAICSWTHSVDHLERYTRMTDLRLLCLRNCSNLNDDFLIKFIESCPRLQFLDVSYCRELTPKFLERSLQLLKLREPRKDRPDLRLTPPLLIYCELCGFEDFVKSKNLYNSADYRDYIVFADYFPFSERGLSFVDRGYQFDFD
ncbi:uncharacterized protein Dwil_GK20358 [Drosophila willistoni]|uniref:GK20358 n=1 Tax=Drosophila willistoni TaxID=7260 RepID=B4N5A4_DROWI|nr:uncharacterized protein LOC6645902 [Drosophila willistoni]EDW79543.1 uncharacterized protein Dwil_GK20358 [Drosophila willistoni]